MKILEEANVKISTDNPRGGVDVHFNMSADEPLQQSPAWVAGGRRLQFFRLAPSQVLSLPPGDNYVKVITGRLDNLDRTCLAAPFTVRSTRVDTSEVSAGEEGALFAVMTLAEDAPATISDMAQLEFEGAASSHITWQRFDQKFGTYTDIFDGKDCHMANGLHLLDEDGHEVVYVNLWTCGKGVNLSTHNHGNAPSPMAPAFAEVHWVLASGTPASGMYETPEPGAEARVWHPMDLGDEHGPFYDRDAAGRPVIRENGAVQYPWHGWEGGEDDEPEQRYDFVAAFEIDPDCIEACV